MVDILKAGGLLMWPILLCSILAIAIIVERYWALRPSQLAPKDMLSKTWMMLKNGQLDQTKLKSLKAHPGLGRILSAGINNARQGRDVMKSSIEDAASHVSHEMERFLGALGTIATIAPLLGLLGTVLGMIEVFSAIMLEGSGNAAVLAGGISKALITTAAGLSVAIPAVIFHRHLTRRVDSILVTMEQECVKLVDALHSSEKGD